MALARPKFRLVEAANVWAGPQGWELLFYYNIYRFCLAVLLVALAFPGFNLTKIGFENQALNISIAGFFAISFIAFISIRKRSPAIHILAHALFLLDILFLSVLTLSNSLQNTNIVIFYITIVAATAVMFRTKTAFGYASICTLVIYFRDVMEIIRGETTLDRLYLTALTALGLFTIVYVVSRIAQQTQVVQDVLEQQRVQLADLDDINRLIVEQMEIGVLFLGSDLSIHLSNHRARELVGDYIGNSKVTAKLADLLRTHIEDAVGNHFTFTHKNKVLSLNTIPMRHGIMVRIEDNTMLSRRIQQSKLSSVGRLASSISHEIRNPLNAISHAAQLMRPQEASPENEELIGIIRKHVKRIDDIVDSFLDRSGADKVEQQRIDLESWLDRFIKTFKQTIGDEPVAFTNTGESIDVDFDPTQLEQILTNLCQNSLKYGKTQGKSLEISMVTGRDEYLIPFLNIMDNGAAIPEGQIEYVFEPFFTTDSRSTGLGLYLSMEFCRLNGADISYFCDVDKHGFRISFQDK